MNYTVQIRSILFIFSFLCIYKVQGRIVLVNSKNDTVVLETAYIVAIKLKDTSIVTRNISFRDNHFIVSNKDTTIYISQDFVKKIRIQDYNKGDIPSGIAFFVGGIGCMTSLALTIANITNSKALIYLPTTYAFTGIGMLSWTGAFSMRRYKLGAEKWKLVSYNLN